MSAIRPIKRSTHIVKLSKDHHFSLLFCWKIRSGIRSDIEQDRIIGYIQYFWTHHMQPHFLAEERILFSQINSSQVQKAVNEHLTIADQIKKLNATEANLKEQLSILVDLVDRHVRYEERVLFPLLEQVMSEEQLISVEKQLEAIHDTTLKDDYGDEFWLENKSDL
jgi:hemerythrin-like domain-containing protein